MRISDWSSYVCSSDLGGEGILALVVGIAVVEVAVDQHLPGDFHGVAVNGGVDGEEVFFGIVGNGAVVGQRNDVFAIGKHIARTRIALRAQAVDARGGRDFNDLVGFHDVAANARDAIVDRTSTRLTSSH